MDFYGTLGPACQGAEILRRMFDVGMTGVRLNLSHSDLKDCTIWLDALRKGASGRPYELLIDLRGPELRIGRLESPMPLEIGSEVLLGAGVIPVPIQVLGALQPEQHILLDDGAILLEVKSCDAERAVCKVLRGGILQSGKSIALPGADLRLPTLTESDLANLSCAAENGVTGVMLPFVRDAQDLKNLRMALQKAGAAGIRVFAKLENQEGVMRLSELLPDADEIVIARGDLGNAMPLWELPAIQKRVAAACCRAEKPFMVVTQMLHSMQKNAVPTRAEVSDVFNAVLDGAHSLMLTGETAVGNFPVQAMEYFVKTAKQASCFLKER